MLRKKSKKSEINLNRKKKPPTLTEQVLAYMPLDIFEDKVLLAAIGSALVFFALLIFQSMQLSDAVSQKQHAKQEKDRVIYTYSYWKQVVKTHPDYRDGYVMLALLGNQLGDRMNSHVYIQKAREIDPNFEKAKQIELLLKK